MAAEDAFASHPATSEYATAFYSLVGVLRASWMKPAKTFGHHITYEAMIERERLLIKPDESQKELVEHRTRIRLPPYFVN